VLDSSPGTAGHGRVGRSGAAREIGSGRSLLDLPVEEPPLESVDVDEELPAELDHAVGQAVPLAEEELLAQPPVGEAGVGRQDVLDGDEPSAKLRVGIHNESLQK